MTRVPVTYKHGEIVKGQLLTYDGKEMVPIDNDYWQQFFWAQDFLGMGVTIGAYYSVGITYVPSGEVVTLESVMARCVGTSQTMKVYKRAFGGTAYTQICPASGYLTVSSTGSTQTNGLPVTLNSGDELFVSFGTNAFSSMVIALNLKHKKS